MDPMKLAEKRSGVDAENTENSGGSKKPKIDTSVVKRK